MKRFLTSIFLLQLLASSAMADFNNAAVFYATGQYDQSYMEMRPLAEQSNHQLAQYYLGVMFSNGQGVEQDYKEAAKWYRKSAVQGVAPAQYRLGELYLNGHGLPRDSEFAYAWLSVAADAGHKEAIQALNDVVDTLNTEELEEAKKLSSEYLAKYKKKEKPDVIKR